MVEVKVDYHGEGTLEIPPCFSMEMWTSMGSTFELKFRDRGLAMGACESWQW